MQLALNVGAMLIAFYAVIMLANHILGWLGSFSPIGTLSINQHLHELSNARFDTLSLQAIFGFVFAPLAWLVGVGGSEVLSVGQLIGTKTFATEFFAYMELSNMKAEGLSGNRYFLGLLHYAALPILCLSAFKLEGLDPWLRREDLIWQPLG